MVNYNMRICCKAHSRALEAKTVRRCLKISAQFGSLVGTLIMTAYANRRAHDHDDYFTLHPWAMCGNTNLFGNFLWPLVANLC